MNGIYPQIFCAKLMSYWPETQVDTEVVMTRVVPKRRNDGDRKFKDHRDHGGVWNGAVSWQTE